MIVLPPMPPMPPEQTASWIGLLDLHERLPEGWTLIGGQVVHLHCAERGQFPVRPTNDGPRQSLRGLPDDQCQAPHGGYVLAGRVTFKTSSGEETFETGDAYYAPRVTPRCSTRAPRLSSSA